MQNIPVVQSPKSTGEVGEAKPDHLLTRAEVHAQILAGTASPDILARRQALIDSLIRLRENCKIFDDLSDDLVDHGSGQSI
jgi:hypothetical protein